MTDTAVRPEQVGGGHRRRRGVGRWRWTVSALAALVAFGLSLRLVEFSLPALVEGLPTMASWVAASWPPAVDELDLILLRAAETVAIALVGTTLATLAALVLCVPAARNLVPGRLLRLPAKLFLDTLRGVDSFVFALLFVAAVGLGPFAGMLGVAFHATGSIAKLFAESIEATAPGPLEAAELTGAGRIKTFSWSLLPDVAPTLASVSLYMFEFNIRSSIVLGVVGAGGIGQQLKNAIDLLNFPRVLTIVIVILMMVTAVDQLSARLRRALG